MKHLNIEFFGFDFSGYQQYMTQIVGAVKLRAGRPGQFLNWIDLPQKQIGRVDHIYDLVARSKDATGANKLVVLGIGGSKHPIEHALSINGLNIDGADVLFWSDIDSLSVNRLMKRIGDVTRAVFLVVSKSGTTFETTDALKRVKKMLVDEYTARGDAAPDICASKHFIAVTDADAERSSLRRTSDTEKWLGDLYIHDDVGGRFSAFDDHVLFALAFAGMKRDDMRSMLISAAEMSERSLSESINENVAVQMALFWAVASQHGVADFVHLYMGDVFEKTVLWHTQMQNESIKNTRMQIAKIPDAMHHSAEAHFNDANKYAVAITMPVDTGVCTENANAYKNAIAKSYSAIGPTVCEYVSVDGLGLTVAAAGALTQMRAFATIYQEVVRHVLNGAEIPDVLQSVLQPYVEVYKQNLKGGVVVPGRMSE